MLLLIYNDKGTKRIVNPINNTSRILSSITGTIKEIIKSRFPENYFKHIYISTEESVSQQYRNQNRIESIYKKSRPFLSITPGISPDVVADMNRSHLISMGDTFLYRDLRRNYTSILFDPYDGNEIYYIPVYITTSFDCMIAVSTYTQNVDLYYHLYSVFKYNAPYYYDNIPVEFQIPKKIIHTIARKKYGEDYLLTALTPGGEHENRFLKYLQTFSGKKGLIVRKRNNSTGNTEFFFRTLSNLLIIVDEPQTMETKQYEGQSESEYQTTFRMTASLWVPNAFILNMTDMTEEIDEVFQKTDEHTNYVWNYNPMFAKSEYFRFKKPNADEFEHEDDKYIVGREILWEPIIPEVNVPLTKINFGVYANPDMIAIIKYALNQDLDLDDIFFVRLFRGNKLLEQYPFADDPEYKTYEIDWETMSINIFEPVANEIHVLGIYIERLKYEKLIELIRSREISPGHDILETVIFKDDEHKYVANVYKFKSNKELYSTNPKYMLRIMTKYGPGYIKLGDENSQLNNELNEQLSDIKICIGYDNEEPIIKRVIVNNIL